MMRGMRWMGWMRATRVTEPCVSPRELCYAPTREANA